MVPKHFPTKYYLLQKVTWQWRSLADTRDRGSTNSNGTDWTTCPVTGPSEKAGPRCWATPTQDGNEGSSVAVLMPWGRRPCCSGENALVQRTYSGKYPGVIPAIRSQRAQRGNFFVLYMQLLSKCKITVRNNRGNISRHGAQGLAHNTSSPTLGHEDYCCHPRMGFGEGLPSLEPKPASPTRGLNVEPRLTRGAEREGPRKEDHDTRSFFTLNIPISHLWSIWKCSKVVLTTFNAWPASKSAFLQK